MRNTPLHIAVVNDYLLMVKILVKNKVDLLSLNQNQFTCLELAYRMSNDEIYNFLEP